MLELRNVSYAYADSDREAVEDVSLAVGPGERVCLMGHNGSGKSTIARLACADVLPGAGEVLLDGMPVNEPGAGGAIALVCQDPREQITSLLVGEEVALGPRCHGLDERDVERRVAEALARCDIGDLVDRSTGTLSGGQLQLVAIAASLALHPHYLVLDEAGSHLDDPSHELLAATVASLQERGLGVLQVTHDERDLLGATRVLCIQDGRLVGEGAAMASGGRAMCGPLASDEAPGLGLADEAPELGDLSFLSPARPAALELRDVSLSLGGTPVISRLSLTAAPGELVLLCGRSGVGKSSAAQLLAGVLRPDSGSALLGESEVRPGRVGLSFQRPEDQLFSSTTWDDVAYGPRNLGLDEPEVARRTELALRAFGIPEEQWALHPQALSGGTRRRVALASIVSLAPGAYVLDEPTAGLDGPGKRMLHETVAKLRAAGCPVVLVTHAPAEWAGEATRVLRLGETPAPVPPPRRGVAAQGRAARPRRGLLLRTGPSVRCLALLVLTVALFSCRSLVGMGLAGLLVAALLADARVDLRGVGRTLLPAVPLLSLVLLGNALRLDGSAPLALTSQLGLSPDGLRLGALAVMRIVVLVALVSVIARGLSTIDVLVVVRQLTAPLARLGVVTADVSMVVSVTLCLMPQVYEEFWRIERAQRARAALLDAGGPLRRLRAWAAVMVPLVVLLFGRADALAHALRLRGYDGSISLPRVRWQATDWLALGLAVALSLAIAAL